MPRGEPEIDRENDGRGRAGRDVVLFATGASSARADDPSTAPQVAAAAKTADEDEAEPRLSLATEDDRAAWRKSGFRLGLGFVYGQLTGLGGAPNGKLIGPVIRIGLRLDARWSVHASFQYLSASTSGGLSGLRFAGTIDPTFNLTPSLSIAVGFGFGGFVEGRTGRADPAPLPSTLESSYTFPDARTPLASCNGAGAGGLLRVEWGYVLGPRSLTGLALEGVAQRTACVDDTQRVEPDSGTSIVRRQFWSHIGVTLAWGIAWR